MSQTLTYDLLTTPARVLDLETEWIRLYAENRRPGTVFHQFHRIKAWLSAFTIPDTNATLAVITGRHDGELLFVLPLIQTATLGLKKLSWLGEPAIQYGDCIIAPELDSEAVCTDALTYALAETGADLVTLRRVRDDAAIAPALRQVGAAKSNVQFAPFLDLSTEETSTAYEERYASKARRNRRRLLRRLEAEGAVAFRRHEANGTAAETVATALGLKRAWLRERGEISLTLADRRIDDWLTAMARELGAECRVTEMRCDGRLAAAQIGFRDGDRLALYLIVFAPEFERHGAGSLHLEQTIRESYDEGVRYIDLLAPKADYKMKWADDAVPLCDYTVPATVRGRIATNEYIRNSRAGARNVLAALPKPVRRTLSRLVNRAPSAS